MFKDPVTDSGTKKSAKGLLRIESEGGKFVLYDQQNTMKETQGLLEEVFKDGKLTKKTTFSEVVSLLAS